MRLRDLGFILPFGLALLPAGAVALIAAAVLTATAGAIGVAMDRPRRSEAIG